MQHVLSDIEKIALSWVYSRGVVYCVKRNEPSFVTLASLVKKRLLKRRIRRHPIKPKYIVTHYLLTTKGKRYHNKLNL